jgi:hypothetical protein
MSQVGFVYKLCCIDPEIKEVYVGSTKNLRVRKGQHKYSCDHENDSNYHLNVYQFIRANGGFSNFDIIQLERVEFNTKYELHARERHFIELLKATLNKVIPTRTKTEYTIATKDHKIQYDIKYRKDNKVKKKQIDKDYREKNKEAIKEFKNKKTDCECGGKYTHCHKALHLRSVRHQNYVNSII